MFRRLINNCYFIDILSGKDAKEHVNDEFGDLFFCSSSGWEHVVKGLVQLGFLLMDSFGPRLVFGRQEVITVGRLTPNQSACQLGSKILQKMFKVELLLETNLSAEANPLSSCLLILFHAF